MKYNHNYDIITNTKNIKKGDVFFCYQSAEKYIDFSIKEYSSDDGNNVLKNNQINHNNEELKENDFEHDYNNIITILNKVKFLYCEKGFKNRFFQKFKEEIKQDNLLNNDNSKIIKKEHKLKNIETLREDKETYKFFLKKIKNLKNKIIERKELDRELIKQLKKRYKVPNKLIGITGTKGKTSTSWYVFQLLFNHSIKSGYIGTIGVYYNLCDNKGVCSLEKNNHLTTPSIDELYRTLNKLKEYGVESCVFEASSHALEQGRITGLKLDCGCWTNLSQDHLDYHKTMDNYFNAKTILFKKYLKKNGFAILNSDDKRFNDMRKICYQRNIKTILCGKNSISDIQITSIKQNKSYQDVDILINQNTLKDNYKKTFYKKFFKKNNKEKYTNNYLSFKTNILGNFQVNNLIEAIAICNTTFNIPNVSLCKSVENIIAPLGRMQRVFDTNIFIDYAHTPKSLEEGLKLLKELYKYIIVVFGCGGNRDKEKRPIMFEIAKSICDFVIITNDNPRNEIPSEIINDILCFEKQDKSNYLFNDNFVIEEIKKINEKYDATNYLTNKEYYSVIEDRKNAIKFAIKMYLTKFKDNNNSCLLIAGKGHEDYQIFKEKTIHFSDYEEVVNFLKCNDDNF